MAKDQAARLAREPSMPALVKINDTWINRRHVVEISWTVANDEHSKNGFTTIRMSDGHSVTVDASPDDAAAVSNEGLQ